MQARTPVFRAEGLKKSYGERAAVIDVSLEVAAGEVLGLLGPNGAGKSTTIAMVCGLTPPDAGRVLVGGTVLAQDEATCKRRIGLVPQDIALFEDLPAQANVELFGALYGLPPAKARRRTTEVLTAVGLADRARDKPATFSGGMKRRLNIACALVHDPGNPGTRRPRHPVFDARRGGRVRTGRPVQQLRPLLRRHGRAVHPDDGRGHGRGHGRGAAADAPHGSSDSSHASAAATSSPGWITAWANPAASAASPDKLRPCNSTSSPRSTPTRRGMRCVPPAPGSSPTAHSGSPMIARGALVSTR